MLNSNATVPNPQHEYAIADTFTVELIVTASNGCIDTVSHPIIIRPGHTFYAPTAFTPNTGLKNNYFYPKGIGVDPNNYHLYIYDRWGQIVFETTVYPEGTADVLPIVSYPNTFRRNLIDFAVKIVSHGGQIIMKIAKAIYDKLRIEELWKLCQSPPVIVWS